MNYRGFLVAALMIFALSGCGQDSTPEQTDAPAIEAAPAETQSADPAPVESETTASEDTTAQTQPEVQAEITAEAKAEVVAAPKPTAPAKPVTLPAGPEPRLGIDYEILASPQPLYAGGDKVEIAEIFSYSCGHCARLNPILAQWKKTLPDYVNVAYIPLVYGQEPADNLARVYFVGEALGVLDKSHEALFNAFLASRIRTGALSEFEPVFAEIGVESQKLNEIAKSFGMSGKLNRAKQFAQRAGITGTPTIIVNGKYKVMAGQSGFEGMLYTAEWLAARERIAK